MAKSKHVQEPEAPVEEAPVEVVREAPVKVKAAVPQAGVWNESSVDDAAAILAKALGRPLDASHRNAVKLLVTSPGWESALKQVRR